MASGGFNFEADGPLQGRIEWGSSSNGPIANSSNVSATLYARRTDGYTTTGRSWSGYVQIGSSTKPVEFDDSVDVGGDWVVMAALSNVTIGHSSDGSGSAYLYGEITGPSGTSLASRTSVGSATVTLDKIPRYATSNQSLNTKTVNSIKMNWSSDSTIDYIWYSTNNGSSWTAVGSVNASSGNYTITGLSPNTTYNIKTRVRRKDSQLTTNSSNLSVTTYQIATLSSVPNVNIGASQTITWANPGSSAISLKLCKTDNTQIINYGTVTGTSKTVTPTASTIYALTPNSNTYKARYILTTTVNGTSYTNYKDFTFTVTNSNPTFSNFTFKNTNTTTYNGNKKLDDLTGSDQILVKGFSNVQVTISDANKAIAKNSATMKNYSMTIGTKSATNSNLTYPLTMSANAIDNSSIVVAAVDSRGNSTKVTKTATYKSYTDLVISSVSATRSNNGVGSTVTINFNGSFWNSSFGSISNTIVSTSYKYKKTTESSWSAETAVTLTISGGSYNASITPNIVFDVASSYYIYVTVKDYLETRTYQITVGAGTPALAIYKDRVAIGKKYDTSEGSKLQVNGDVKADNFKGNATSATSATSATNVTQKKSASSVTHTNYGTNNGYLPDISFLSYWNGAYSSGNSSNLTYAHQGTIQCKPKNLYNNTSGNTGTITLTETSANFNYIEIFYGKKSDIDSQIKYNSMRVYSPNGKRPNLILFHRAENNVMQLIGATITISGTSVTKNYYHTVNFYSNGNIGGGSVSDNSISIFRIDGYK